MRSLFYRVSILVATVVTGLLFLTALDSFVRTHRLPAVAQPAIPGVRVAEARLNFRIISPSIQSELELLPSLRLVEVVGHIHCDAGEQLRVDVVITQEATGAQAVGHTPDICTGEVQTWTARAGTRSAATLEPGPAQACAVAVTRLRGQVTDSFSWCKSVILVEN
jgi:hypothetical protein